MWWYLFQSLIMFAVMGSNIQFEWTPNGYVAGSIAGGVALSQPTAADRDGLLCVDAAPARAGQDRLAQGYRAMRVRIALSLWRRPRQRRHPPRPDAQ